MAKNTAETPGGTRQDTVKTPDSIWSVMKSLENDTASSIQVDIERIAPSMFNGVPIRGLVDSLAGPVTLEEFKTRYGGGQYKIEIRRNGRYHSSERVWIPGLPVLDPDEAGMSGLEGSTGSARVANRPIDEGQRRKNFLEELLLTQKLFGHNGNGNGLTEKLIMKIIDSKPDGKNGLDDNLKTMSQVLGFAETLAKKITPGDYEPTLEGEIVKNIPQLIDLLSSAKNKTQDLQSKVSQPRREVVMDDLQYLIFKIASFIKGGETPDRAADLAFDILDERQVDLIANQSYDSLKESLYPKLPASIKKVFDSEEGKTFLNKFLEIVKAECQKESSSQTEKPESKQKLSLSGGLSNKDGKIQKSGKKQNK